MPEIEVQVEIWCSCGEGLCNQSTPGKDRHGDPKITVEPCQKCLDSARDDGRESGREEGYKEGKDDGYAEGRESLQSEMDAEKANERKAGA